MLEQLSVVLAESVKSIIEKPSFLIGLPLLALGALGALIAMSPIELRWPERPRNLEAEILPPPPGQPTAQVYIQVGAILAVITALEVAIYYTNLIQGLLISALLALSAMKFVLVVLWFMHLRFDTKLFTVLFGGALAGVLALFMVVLVTLGASFV
jgi:cytochrome c oxidase subunit 4